MIFRLTLLINLTLLSCSFHPIQGNERIYPELPESIWKDQAQIGMTHYLNLIPTNELQYYGFKNAEELKQVTLGQPTNMIFATGKNHLPDSVQILAIPITVNGENRTLLQMSKQNDEWHCYSLGSSGIAQRIQEMQTKDPSLKDATLYRVPWRTKDYLILQKNKKYEAHVLFGEPKLEIWDSIPQFNQ